MDINYHFPKTEWPNEFGTLAFGFTFRDEAGTAIVPNEAAWSLLDASEGVVNGRTAVTITPATTAEIVLTGADLATNGKSNVRFVLVTWRYDSDKGSNLYGNWSGQFVLLDQPGIT